MEPIVCPCGTEKDTIHNITVCRHCDGGACPDRTGCYLCGQYSLATNQRVAAEHAREKRK